MSDTVYKIIPVDYSFTPNDVSIIEGAVKILKMYIDAEKITWKRSTDPEFIDCGENLESISCPFCNKNIEMDIWQEMMNEAYETSKFNDLSINLSCCNKSSTLNDLKYNMECGFSKFVIEIVNPQYPPCKHDLHEASKCFGKLVAFKQVKAHY